MMEVSRNALTQARERLGGAWLAKVRVAKDLVRANASVRRRVLLHMQGAGIDLQGYVRSNDRNQVIERKLLKGLTRAASKGNKWAIKEISWIGSEFGEALAAFELAFRDYEAVSSIVLVSTIAERLGKTTEGGGTQIRKDVLMDALRKSMESTLNSQGMDKGTARAIASGVRRSIIGSEREFLAFDPA